MRYIHVDTHSTLLPDTKTWRRHARWIKSSLHIKDLTDRHSLSSQYTSHTSKQQKEGPSSVSLWLVREMKSSPLLMGSVYEVAIIVMKVWTAAGSLRSMKDGLWQT